MSRSVWFGFKLKTVMRIMDACACHSGQQSVRGLIGARTSTALATVNWSTRVSLSPKRCLDFLCKLWLQLDPRVKKCVISLDTWPRITGPEQLANRFAAEHDHWPVQAVCIQEFISSTCPFALLARQARCSFVCPYLHTLAFVQTNR